MAFSASKIAFLMASLALFAVGYQAAAVIGNGIHQSDDFHVIGSVNNKTFYTPKNDSLMNWMGAGDLCNAFGLELAAFKTSEEFQFVRSHVPENHTRLWVGAALIGMDILRPNPAFEWQDGSNVTTTGNFIVWPAHYLCVIFSQDDHLYTDFCISGRYKPLCQNVPAANSTNIAY